MQPEFASALSLPDAHRAGFGPMPFAVALQRSGENCVVQVCGELDLSTAPKLSDVLVCLCRADTGDLQIDASLMSFCDCSGLSVLLAAARRRRGRGGRFTLANPTAPVRRLIALAGLDESLSVQPSDTDVAYSPGASSMVAHRNRRVTR